MRIAAIAAIAVVLLAGGCGRIAPPAPPPSPPAQPSPSATTPVSVIPGLPLGIPGKWHLVFSDSFSGRTLNTRNWSTGWFGNGVTSDPEGAKSPQCMSPANVQVNNGELDLVLSRVPSWCNGKQKPWTSGMVTTDGKFQFTYGVMEARIWVPGPAGGPTQDWASFWAVGQSWLADGELDVVETFGQPCSYYHAPGLRGSACASPAAGRAAGTHSRPTGRRARSPSTTTGARCGGTPGGSLQRRCTWSSGSAPGTDMPASPGPSACSTSRSGKPGAYTPPMMTGGVIQVGPDVFPGGRSRSLRGSVPAGTFPAPDTAPAGAAARRYHSKARDIAATGGARSASGAEDVRDGTQAGLATLGVMV